MKKRIRVLCVDDHLIVRDGIAFIINSQPDMRVVAATGSGWEAIALFRKHHPDVTVMDLRLPDLSGIEATRTICRESADARIVVLTAHHGDDDVSHAFGAGAVSYVFKDSMSCDLIRIIREVHAGEQRLPAGVAAILAAHKDDAALTPREREILALIATGMRNKEIADALRLSEMTIQAHNKRIFAKLNVSDRTAAVTVAVRRGIIHLSEDNI